MSFAKLFLAVALFVTTVNVKEHVLVQDNEVVSSWDVTLGVTMNAAMATEFE